MPLATPLSQQHLASPDLTQPPVSQQQQQQQRQQPESRERLAGGALDDQAFARFSRAAARLEGADERLLTGTNTTSTESARRGYGGNNLGGTGSSSSSSRDHSNDDGDDDGSSITEKRWLSMSRPSSSAIGAVSGVTAGAVSAFITCPLDLVKTRMQNQIRTPLPSTLYASDGRQIYRSTSHALRTIFAEDGVRGLFRGLPVVLLGCMSNWAVYFTSYQILKQELAERMDKQQTETSVLIMAAMGAGALTSVATSPLWVVKSRIMTQSKTTEYNYTGTLHAFRDIWIKEGWRGYYKGLGSSLLGVSHVAIQFPIYEKMKMLTGADGLLHNNGRKRSDEDLAESGDVNATSKAVERADDHWTMETARLLAASIPAKFAASIATYPHEVIRTRLQNQATDPPRYRGIIHAVIKIFREEGPRAYYQGLSTNLIRTVPNSAITLLVYELMYRYLHSF